MRRLDNTFYLGTALCILSLAWLITIVTYNDTFTKYIPNIHIEMICYALAILMAIGGYISLYVWFKR